METQATYKLAIVGAGGRMSRALIDAIKQQPSLELTALFTHSESPLCGQDVQVLSPASRGIKIETLSDSIQPSFDVLIDFSLNSSFMSVYSYCAQHAMPLISGTTGLSTEHLAKLQAQTQFPAIYAQNMSLGIHLCVALAEQAALALDTFDIEIIEAHHRHKKDAPSGTALMLGEAICAQRGQDLSATAAFSRQGNVGQRPDNEIGFSVIRGGDIVGEHTVLFAGEGERVEITHKASSRQAFVAGALALVPWIASNLPTKTYSMRDFLMSTGALKC